MMASETGKGDLQDLPCSGCHVTAFSPEMLQCADAIVHKDWCFTTQQVALSLSISKGSVSHIIWKLGFSKVCTRGVPQSLSVTHKTERIAVSSNLLASFEVVGETLSQIVTADETWAYCFELETKKALTKWYHPQSPHKKFKRSLQGHNHCLLGLWRTDSSGCDTERKDNKLQNLHQHSDRTQEAFQTSSASQKSNRNLASAWQCKAALKFEEMGSHHKIWLDSVAPT